MTRLTTELIIRRMKAYQENGLSMYELAKCAGCSRSYLDMLIKGARKSLTIELGNKIDDALKKHKF